MSTNSPKVLHWCCEAIAFFFALSCGRQDGTVGRMYPADASNNPSVFETDFAENLSTWSTDTGLPGATVMAQVTDPEARDGYVAELRFPGSTSSSSTNNVGPNYVTQLATSSSFSFGKLQTSVKFGTCTTNEETIQSILGYFNDGTDLDQNGITDDIELNIQVMCGALGYLYLTVFTDYESTPTGENFRKMSHIIDFNTGTEYENINDNSDEFAITNEDASLKRPDLLVADQFYELGFEWHSDQVRFFLVDGLDEVTLWTLNDVSHVPQRPVNLMYNLWHPSSHWYPAYGAADFPANDVVMRVDWLRYESF
jgi:hypothetical protein